MRLYSLHGTFSKTPCQRIACGRRKGKTRKSRYEKGNAATEILEAIVRAYLQYYRHCSLDTAPAPARHIQCFHNSWSAVGSPIGVLSNHAPFLLCTRMWPSRSSYAVSLSFGPLVYRHLQYLAVARPGRVSALALPQPGAINLLPGCNGSSLLLLPRAKTPPN